MKSCSEIIELLSLYIDNELDNETKNEIDEHIKTCEICKSELDALKEIVGALGSFEEVELPSGFREELHEKLMAEKNKNELKSKTVPFKKKFVGFSSSIAAGLIMVFVAGSLIMTRGLFGNAPKDSSGVSMSLNRDKISGTALNDNSQSDEYGNENNYQVETSFNGHDISMKARQYDGGSDAVGEEGTKEFADNSINSTAPAPEDASTYGITVAGIPIYDVYITINSSDIEKEIDNINNIAISCNIEIEVKMEKSAPEYDAVSSPKENKKVLSFDMDSTKYNDFVNKLKEKYGNNLSLDEETNGEGTMKKVEITVLKE
ncbi:anti-sigma factor family protein [Acetivibrio mesophilus]|uniref:Anti-sigma-W factor RsiW n=1 Tax=Acetivibrio mesophilus TaxID=2487273 RepID=A0A4Q0I722_9FIRM|nr:anti-sigma factor [Acetivibrio mesophilus]ODM25253.1 hypothetical protein A7W90_02915 [Clostridium sp. Bc-iso-3]RXE59727.1 anti-sigma factor [Acetivibrio mesophilus]HHV28551.1 anti-sigma factor [Clostridium sp.]